MAMTALAGAMSSVCSNPIWMVNTRIAIHKKNKERVEQPGTLEVVREIYEQEGVGAFFKGVVPNLILILNPVINFAIYEQIKKIFIKKFGSEKNIPSWGIFVMSSIGKIFATLATYPILTIKVLLQASKGEDADGWSKVNSWKDLV